METETARIRDLNDAFRTTGLGGRVVVTRSLKNAGDEYVDKAIERTRAFTAFNSDNDPHGEHDFGNFVLDGRRLFWKIDYYDTALEDGSANPADPTVTTRVLTVMFAEDY